MWILLCLAVTLAALWREAVRLNRQSGLDKEARKRRLRPSYVLRPSFLWDDPWT
jgi:hypothetical protein